MIGHRVGRLVDGWLTSPYRGDAWPAGRRVTARCAQHDDPPGPGCECGVWVAPSREVLDAYLVSDTIAAEVREQGRAWWDAATAGRVTPAVLMDALAALARGEITPPRLLAAVRAGKVRRLPALERIVVVRVEYGGRTERPDPSAAGPYARDRVFDARWRRAEWARALDVQAVTAVPGGWRPAGRLDVAASLSGAATVGT